MRYIKEVIMPNENLVVYAKTHGFIRRQTIELKHSKVESLQVNQGIIGRIFNFGSINIIGSGGTTAPIPYIKDPLTFRSAALTQEENNQSQD